VLLTEPLELAEDGRLMLTEEEGLNFVGGFSTLTQFLQEQRKDRHTEEVEAESISYAVCKYFGIETGENSFGYIASWSQGKELKELRASLETINKTSGTLISDIERHYKEICKERGIDPHAKAEPETAPIEQPTGNLTYYVAECMEFPNLGEYHDNLSLEEAVRIYQEIPAERMNGIKGIGFELKDGSDYEGPFPILTGQTIDLDTIQAIDYYRDNPLVQKAVKELAATMPEMEVLGADANQQEALFLINDTTYLHIQPCDSGWDYTLYDAASMKELDGGQLDAPELSRMKAVLQICDDNDLDSTSLRHAPLSMIETLQEAAYQQMQAEVGQMAASSQLPEAQEQALDEYPTPDEQVSTPDMQEYGYSYDGMLPVTRERALELDAAGLTVYVLHEDNTESMVFDPQEIMDHGGLFGVDHEEWEKSPQFHEKVMER
ncbi:DNA primase, partial [[Clostridium] innocuum]|nr:DNA primase [[Clostridium] innocuum]